MEALKTNAGNRRNPISYRLTDAEFLPLQAVAERAGLKVNELCRRLAVQTKGEALPLPGFRPDPAVVKWLQAIGVALFKIRDIQQGSLAPEQTAELVEAVKKISDFVDAAVEERVRE